MPTILVVEDEPDLGELTLFLLQSHGYETQYAINGEVALQKLAQDLPALVVTDYMMPVMDGYELVMAMKRMESLAEVPVLMVSALPEDVVRKKCPFAVFIRKPFTAEELLAAVRSLLGSSR